MSLPAATLELAGKPLRVQPAIGVSERAAFNILNLRADRVSLETSLRLHAYAMASRPDIDGRGPWKLGDYAILFWDSVSDWDVFELDGHACDHVISSQFGVAERYTGAADGTPGVRAQPAESIPDDGEVKAIERLLGNDTYFRERLDQFRGSIDLIRINNYVPADDGYAGQVYVLLWSGEEVFITLICQHAAGDLYVHQDSDEGESLETYELGFTP